MSLRARGSEFADLDRQLDALLDDGDGVDEIDVDRILDERLDARDRDDDELDEDDEEPDVMHDTDDLDDEEEDDLVDDDDAPEASSWMSHRGLSEDDLRARSRDDGRRDIEALRALCAARRAA